MCNIVYKNIKYLLDKYSTYVFVISFLFYSIWKFYPAFESEITVSFPHGDGIGTISWFVEVANKTHNLGISYFLSDLTKIDMSGLGAYPDAPVNVVQKAILYIISFFVQGDNIYDTYAFIGFYLIGLSSYILFREFKIHFLLSLLGAILIANNDNMFARLSGHLTLGISFAPILLTYIIIKASKTLDLRVVLLIPIIIVFNYSMNEYYGYFGMFFSFFLFFGMYGYHNSLTDLFSRERNILLWKSVAIIIFLFIALMVLVYPNLIGQKFIKLFMNVDNELVSSPVIRSYEDFILYSIKNPWYFFNPKIDFFHQLINNNFFTENTFWEQSFRIGIVVPLFLFLVLITFFIYRIKGIKIEKELFLVFFVFPSILIIYFLSIDPTIGFSLVNFTYKVSEIFRVSSRAYVYIFIIFILLYLFYLDYVIKRIRMLIDNSLLKKFLILSLLFGVIYVVSLKDVTGKTFGEQVEVYKLPEIKIYKYLASLEKGLVLELPFYHFPENVFEDGYIYNYNRSIYQFRVLNAILPPDNEYYSSYGYLYNILRKLDNNTIKQIRNLGVKYIVLDMNKIILGEDLENEMILLKEMANKKLFLIKNNLELESSVILDKLKLLSTPVLDEDKLIEFNNSSSVSFFRSSFATTEEWGTWTQGTKAKLSFISKLRNNSYLEIEFRVFSDGKHEQNVTFNVNGKNEMTIKTFRNIGTHKIRIPLENNEKEINELTIELPNAVSPNQLNMNKKDNRLLGIGLINMRLVNSK